MKIYMFLVLLLTIINFFELFSQNSSFNQPFANEIIPPRPISSVFRQFAGYTPSLATGSVNVPIPLYELKVGDYSLPFNLQYFTSGIKVMEPASPSGYGWSLHPGLRITRTVRGRADGLSIFPMQIKSQSTVNSMSDDERFYYLRSLVKSTLNQDNPNYLINNDSQYDIFTLHLPSGNFSFIIKNGVAVSYGNMLKIKILSDGYCICGFEVTDEYGTVYHFGKEKQDSDISLYTEITTDLTNIAYSSWMLRKITFPHTKSEINLTWEMAAGIAGYSNYAYYTSFPILIANNKKYSIVDILSAQEKIKSYKDGVAMNPTLEELFLSQMHLEETLNGNNRYGYDLMLKRVDFPLGSISFDYQGTAFVQSFKVKNLSDETIKKIDFKYGEVEDRMLLKSLTFSDEGVYKFTYHPERFTYFTGQDYWGYYNGASKQGYLYPFFMGEIGGIGIEFGSSLISSIGKRPDAEKMKANILTRVDYPTGGFTEFEYEPHRFEEPTSIYMKTPIKTLSEGRGLRVKKVKTQTNAASQPVTKEYHYGKNNGTGFNTNGLGNVLPISTLDTFLESNQYEKFVANTGHGHGYIYQYKIVYINAMSQLSRLYIPTPPVYYNYVTEWTTSQDNLQKHKTEYTFSSPISDNVFALDIGPVKHYFIKTYKNIFSKGPSLINKKTYVAKNNNYIPLENISYKYFNLLDDVILDLYVTRKWINAHVGLDSKTHEGLNDNAYWSNGGSSVAPDYYEYIDTHIDVEYPILESETKTLYTDDGNIIETAQYQYLNNTLLLSKETISSKNSVVKEEYSYCSLNGRTYAYPTSVKSTNNNYYEGRNTYYHNNKLLPQNISFFKGKDGITDYSNLRLVYHDYNSYGKPLYLTQDDAKKVVYLWGYKGQYPVAEIVNATYDQVKGVIPESTINNIEDANEPSGNAWTQINNLRNSLPNAQIQTYKYKPLVGIAEAVSPSGISTYYEYDSFGRLKYIRDNEQNILSRYAYNYYDGSVKDIDKDTVYQESQLFLEYININHQINRNSPALYTFKANKKGGSGSYNYTWTIKEKTGETIAFHNSGTNGTYNIDMSSLGSGEKQVICSLTDHITDETREVSRTFNVYITPLMFEDIQEQLPYTQGQTCVMSANIYSYSAQNVQFYLWSYGIGGSNVNCTIMKGDGKREDFYWPSPSANINISSPETEMTKKTVSLSAGLNRIEIRFPSGSNNHVKLYLNSIYPELYSRVASGRYLWYGTSMTHPFMY